MEIAITGAGGLIGGSLIDPLKAVGYNVKAFRHNDLDITNYKNCINVFDANKTDLLIHCAGMISVDEAEANPKKAEKVNVEGTYNLALLCAERRIPIVYFSSCSVFDGKETKPYTVWDKPNPVSAYALTKIKAEQIIRNYVARHLIIRSTYIYGKDKPSFVTSAIERLKNEDNPSFPVIDQVLNIANVRDLCLFTVRMINYGLWGTYHFASIGETSRKEIIEYIAKCLGKTNYIFTDYKAAARSKYSILDTSEIEKIFKISHWEDSLRDFIANEF